MSSCLTTYWELKHAKTSQIPELKTWRRGWMDGVLQQRRTFQHVSLFPRAQVSQSELLHADQAGAGACIVNAGLWSNFLRWLLLCHLHLPQLVSIFSVQLKWTRSWCGKKMIYVQVSPLTSQHQHSVTGGFNYSAAMIAACLRSRQFHTICVLTSSSETIHEIVTKAV